MADTKRACSLFAVMAAILFGVSSAACGGGSSADGGQAGASSADSVAMTGTAPVSDSDLSGSVATGGAGATRGAPSNAGSSGAAGGNAVPASEPDVAAFWYALQIDADWVGYYPTLAELVAAADVVLLGTFVSAVATPPLQADAPEDIMQSAYVTIKAEEVLRGELAEGDSMVLAMILPVSGEELVAATIATLNANAPPEPFLVLGRVATEDFYSVVNGWGIWARTPRSPIDTPLERRPPTSGLYAEEIAGLASFEDFVALIRSVL